MTPRQNQPETLHAGDTIEYCSRAFVCGDVRGRRVSVIVRIAQGEDERYPVQIDTGEPLPLDNWLRPLADRFGNPLDMEVVRWRMLKAFPLVDGAWETSSRASALQSRLETVFASAMGSVRRAQGARREETGLATVCDDHDDEFSDGDYAGSVSIAEIRPSAPGTDQLNAVHREDEDVFEEVEEPHLKGSVNVVAHTGVASTPGNDSRYTLREEQTGEAAGTSHVSCSAGQQNEETEELTTLSDKTIIAAEEYLLSIPTRNERGKIRHQGKRKAAAWHVPRSRKKKDQAKCSATRSGLNIYHARSLKAKSVKQLLRLRGVKARLKELRAQRPAFEEVTATNAGLAETVEWPDDVAYIEECRIPKGLTFPDVGEFDKCKCSGDCFMDTCYNAVSGVYCTKDGCGLEAKCSNAPRSRSSLKLFDTHRVGVGVYTTTALSVGDVLGEYTGKLCEYDAQVVGQPNQALKQNSGYTMLLHTKSSRKKFVYIEALECGFTTRFISHACNPNAAFIEKRYRQSVKVFVVMLRSVEAGAQITVNYGDETWFTCACDDCWSRASKADAV